ncbi:MAG: S41 family peptidase [Bacteroidia bacterium]
MLLIIGICIGSAIFRERKMEKFTANPHASAGKIDNILDFIEQNYVDTINRNKLEEKTLIAMLNQLDPHSEYIPAADLEHINEPLQGNFDGIGVDYNVVNDTLCVVHPIPGGPSEKVGIQSGDRIIKVDGKNISGVKITNKKIYEALRGKKGTKVIVSVMRGGSKSLIDFTITRGEIPIYSVEVAYMATPDVGYIKISRFAAATYEEFRKAFNSLAKSGMKKLVIDLRNNGGGYLNAAVDICDEFLSKGMKIVYTKGKASAQKTYFATEKGSFENAPLAVLIDEGSASASEIVSGALQDNDRAVIIGRRSFGKGLVQEQIEIPDGSAIRLTIARYYTPSGRCIQKPYSKGLEAYYSEEFDRYDNGEMLSADSIHFADSLKFKTAGGKTVYGGGGIMPDIFVPLDTSFRTSYLNKISFKGILSDFAFNYTDRHRAELKAFKTAANFDKNFNATPAMLNELVVYAQRQGVEKNDEQLKKSTNYILNQLKALIGRNVFDNEAYFPIILSNDKAFGAALKELERK